MTNIFFSPSFIPEEVFVYSGTLDTQECCVNTHESSAGQTETVKNGLEHQDIPDERKVEEVWLETKDREAWRPATQQKATNKQDGWT